MAIPSYIKTIWQNLTSPAINATNLNKIENGIDTVTTETIAQDGKITDLQSPATTVYNPQPAPPAPHTEGTLFYSDDAHSLAYYNDIADMTLNVGQEIIARIYNNTGATIPNGYAVKSDGTGTAGVPNVILAIADSLNNAFVGGVATHDIPDQTEGFATALGTVSGMDTSLFTVGNRLYLSESVAGWYQETAPEVASYIAIVLVSDAVEGKILVNPNSLLNLPSLSAYMQDLTNTTITVTATPQKFVGYAGESGIVMHGDTVNGIFTALYDGIYDAKAMFVVRDITGTNNTQSLDIYLRINESAVNERAYPLMVGINGEECSGTPFFEIILNAGDTVSLWYGSDDINEDVTVESITFSLTSINIR